MLQTIYKIAYILQHKESSCVTVEQCWYFIDSLVELQLCMQYTSTFFFNAMSVILMFRCGWLPQNNKVYERIGIINKFVMLI